MSRLREPPWRLLVALVAAAPAGAGAVLAGQRQVQESRGCLARSQCQSRSPGITFWDYRDGGARWDVGQCCIGRGQSPLNLTSAMAVVPDGATLFHGYRIVENPIRMINDGKVLTALLEAHFGGVALGQQYPTILSHQWDLWKVVVHTPSEHTFKGAKVPLELQLMHRRRAVDAEPPPADAVAVVAIGFEPGPLVSPLLAALQQGGLPQVQGAETLVNRKSPAVLDFSELFAPPRSAAVASAPKASQAPLDGHFWHYYGSLTSPPCSLGVQWFVRHDPLPAAASQMTSYKEAIHAITPYGHGELGNARKLQPTCKRTVMLRPTADVSSMLDVKEVPQDDGFRSAVNSAVGEQKSFEDSMTTAPPYYADCVAELALTVRDLGTAKEREKLECDAVRVEQQKVEQTAGAGVSRLVAGENLNTQKVMCESAVQSVRALTSELKADQERCRRLRSITEESQWEQRSS